jgi:hypothetical protein
MATLTIAQAATAANCDTPRIRQWIAIGRFGDPTATTVDSAVLAAYLAGRLLAGHSASIYG